MHYQPPAYTVLTPIYIDDHLLVLDKPAGLLSVPGRGEDKQDCLATRVQAEYPEALIVHRLDMGTSGLMLMARSAAMQRQLGMLFEQRQIDKRYIAIVDGKPEHDRGEVNLPLITDWPNRPRQKVDHDSGKSALTIYNVIKYDTEQNASRVELKPRTGRSHQLRVHMQSLGHAILGDELYASAQIREKAPRLLLHAEALSFIHPDSQQLINIHYPAPF